MGKSVFDFVPLDAEGRPHPLSKYRGQVLLIVNVASRCRFTRGGYDTLNYLFNTYNSRGFTALAFPCNQFARQEPGTSLEVREFACSAFEAKFPVLAHVNVNGLDTAPLYAFLKESVPGWFGSTAVKWNFTSFLCDRDGVPQMRYSPGTGKEVIEKDLIKLLNKEPTF